MDSCGLGGPAGTPLSAMYAKLTGSVQLGLQVKFRVHSRLSMLRALHQCPLSHEIADEKPGG